MDRSRFMDIQPYFGSDVTDATQRLASKKEYLGALAYILAGSDMALFDQIMKCILGNLGRVQSYTDFQYFITAGTLIPAIVGKSVDEFTVSGSENLDPNKGYLFISNHRDIILDCMLLDYALYKEEKPLCEMAVGDNLMGNQFVEDLFRLNGGIIVKRSLPMREKYKASLELSEYFVETVSEENTSIWVAQKSGRSKDGIDQTHPSIIKMLYLSQKSKGISFSDLINKCNIVPVAISYQYDPNDINKGREEITKEHNEGKYEKKKYEDVISMVKGLREYKGKVHISIGKPLEGAFEDAEEVSAAIDKQIHLGYKLFDTNYIAYDFMEHSDKFASEYTEKQKNEFLGRFNHLAQDVRDFVLNSYANPVRMMLKEKEVEA